MRIIITVLIALTIPEIGLAEAPRLLLVPAQISIHPNATVECDLYLYNDSNKTISVPSFETLSKVYALRDTSGIRPPRGDSSSLIIDHARPEHTLGPGKVEQTRVRIDISAESGDLAEVYVEIGRDSILRSNSVLLFCPIEKEKEKQKEKKESNP
jgi:hypothetical protein